MHRHARASFVLLLATLSSVTRAEIYCVETAAEFSGALLVAGGNHEHDEIRLRKGTYAMANGVYFDYNASASENFDLELSGGWYQRGTAPCGAQSDNPWETVLDGEQTERVLMLDPGSAAQANISVRLLTFMNGHVEFPEDGGGLVVQMWYGVEDPTIGTVTIESNVFLLNDGDRSRGGLYVNGGFPKITNNLFLLNDADDAGAAMLATWYLFGVIFTNNTVIANGSGDALKIYADRAFVANNNFWDNGDVDVDMTDADEAFLYNNNYQSFALNGSEVLEDNISVEPEYESGLFNYTPMRGSPLVDGGREPQGASPLWYLTEFDLNASPRLVGPHVDIGAYENERIFVDGFDPCGPFGC